MDIEACKQAPSGGLPRKHSVVFADDDPAILLALERALRDEPYDLLLTTNPEKALDWIRNRSVSAVIADYYMPGMMGTTLLELARSHSPRIARILLTGYPGERPILLARECGLLTLYGKPWDDRELKREIRNRLRERELLESS